MIQKIRLTTLIIAACCLLTACGFQLRGNDAYNSALQEFALTGRYKNSDMGKEITRKAEQYGMTVTSDAAWAIEITNDQFTRMRLTGTQNADTDEFLLKRQITFNLVHRHFDQADTDETISTNGGVAGSETYGPVISTRQATYQDNQNQILGKNNEENLIRQELLRDLAAQILRQVDRITQNPPDCTEHENSGQPAP
ncbi:LPS-assembly lipoprotein LptE [BD1-7 clade bacterium]|uniref:LPS-assembly lipoprotein LptE n=1 Tax=BD1-7 clade bacterium TaxID=2029982 RepID=A0A5S9QYA3_9GAMM|nr:LPS-assembly lipoprotein LptE [BD1-7 clade bacterium]